MAETLAQALDRRIAEQTEWLRENAPYIAEQKHLDADTPERAYWHYGYVVAMRDIRKALQEPREDNDDAR